ncbi:MAG: peptidylprolyl isomerase, partial [Gammaproteobacteria bacterium]|nr:peptidylprolyl isomerase [Gammaproteobacteria bacterium]
IEAGMQFHAEGPEGQTVVVTIAAIDGDQVTIDGNHPLASVQLNFDVKIMNIRDASSEELEHGHVHGPEGHAHD